MLTLVLADAELELVPPAIAGHPAVRTSAQRRGRSPSSLLLDSSLHHPALKAFPEGERRGRPDIAHLFVLLCLDSIVNLEGGLQTLVHTRNDELIRFRPDTRIPKNYPRFVGLMEDLFQKKAVPADAPLITLEAGMPLEKILTSLPGEHWAFAEGEAPTQDLAADLGGVSGDLVGVIGGFPHGSFRSPVAKLCDRVVAIHSQPLRAWTVTSEVLAAWRRRTPTAAAPKTKVQKAPAKKTAKRTPSRAPKKARSR